MDKKNKFLTMMHISSQALIYHSTFVSVMKKRKHSFKISN